MISESKLFYSQVLTSNVNFINFISAFLYMIYLLTYVIKMWQLFPGT